MQVGVNQIKSGMGVEMDGKLFYVTGWQHVKPGKGNAFIRMKLKNIQLETVISRTFRTDEKLTIAHIEKKVIQYLYSSKDLYEFMDQETYEQITLHREQLGNVINYLKENTEVTAIVHKNNIISLEAPIFIDLKIVSTEPGVRGDTSKAGTKPAKTESGMAVNVPLFINEGETVRIDTRIDKYVGRA